MKMKILASHLNLKQKKGRAFKKNEEYLIDTNIGEFFTIENKETLEVAVEDSNKEEILKAYIILLLQ